MRIHHLSCGSLCPHGGSLIGGEGGLLSRAEVVCHCLLIESSDEVELFSAHDPHELERARAAAAATA